MVLARMIAEAPQRHDADALAQALDAYRRELERMEVVQLEALRQRMFEGLA